MTTDKRVIVLGTHNRKKGRELSGLFAPWGFEIKTLADFVDPLNVVEDGQTFAENAKLKACQQAVHLGAWVLGEDSGLAVDALGGRPGVYSARFSGAQATDASNNARLLEEMSGVSSGPAVGSLRLPYHALGPPRRSAGRDRSLLPWTDCRRATRDSRIRLRPVVRNRGISPHVRGTGRWREGGSQPSRSCGATPTPPSPATGPQWRLDVRHKYSPKRLLVDTLTRTTRRGTPRGHGVPASQRRARGNRPDTWRRQGRNDQINAGPGCRRHSRTPTPCAGL